MGLLDDLLGQLAGAPSGRTMDPRRTSADAPPGASAGTSGMAQVMIALLPVLLGMLAARQRGQSPGAPQGGGGGGLGDILGQVLGGSARGSGGLGELLEQFQRAGFPDQVRSWVGTGQNLPIPPEAVENVFGPGGLAEIARRAGVSEKDASRGLSELPDDAGRTTPRRLGVARERRLLGQASRREVSGQGRSTPWVSSTSSALQARRYSARARRQPPPPRKRAFFPSAPPRWRTT